uniref:Uncharacterized protein n=1 Tax=Glossina pallidipes TaxID=7398 RepID=A0A1A9Z4B1_GLOPL
MFTANVAGATSSSSATTTSNNVNNNINLSATSNSAAVTASLAATNTLSVSDAITAPLVNLAAGDWDAQSCSPNLVLMSALPLPQLSLNSIDEAVERPMAGVSLLGDGPVCHIVEERDDCKTLTLPVMTANLGSLRQPFNVCSTVSSDCSMPSPSSLHLTSPKKVCVFSSSLPLATLNNPTS